MTTLTLVLIVYAVFVTAIAIYSTWSAVSLQIEMDNRRDEMPPTDEIEIRRMPPDYEAPRRGGQWDIL